MWCNINFDDRSATPTKGHPVIGLTVIRVTIRQKVVTPDMEISHRPESPDRVTAVRGSDLGLCPGHDNTAKNDIKSYIRIWMSYSTMATDFYK